MKYLEGFMTLHRAILIGILVAALGFVPECKKTTPSTPEAKPKLPQTTPGFVYIKAGTFTMGSPTSEPGHLSSENQHQVTLTVDFEIMDHEFTLKEYKSLTADSGVGIGSVCEEEACPLEGESWNNVLVLANALSSKHGYDECFDCSEELCRLDPKYPSVQACPGFRLPTEAEWEYAARAGSNTTFYNGPITKTSLFSCTSLDPKLDEIAWYCANADGKIQPTKGKKPNAWGLYDMIGNVAEWVWDWHGPYPDGPVVDPTGPPCGSYKVIRGGRWDFGATQCRVAGRDFCSPVLGYYEVYQFGFRLVRSLPPLKDSKTASRTISKECEDEAEKKGPVTVPGDENPVNAWQATIEALMALHWEFDEAEKKNDVRRYFKILPNLSMEPGYSLGYKTLGDEGEAWPHLFAKKKGGEPDFEYMRHVKTDGTEEGFFQYVVLDVMGGQFDLEGHSNYDDEQIVADFASFERTCSNDDYWNFDIPSKAVRERALILVGDFQPEILMTEKTVQVSVVVFSSWGGFMAYTYVISTEFPHKVLKKVKQTIVPWDCEGRF